MSLILPRRLQPIGLLFLYPCLLTSSIQHFGRRHASSARRTTKRLRNKPDSSFNSTAGVSNQDDHVILNPPSSAPSPYHTPPAFLPPNDPRRALHAQTFSHYNPYQNPSKTLPPPVREQPAEKKYHLKPQDFEEIRRLRASDPDTWTRRRLAEKFGCSQFFVGLVSQASEERLKSEEARKEANKAKWGVRRRTAREERAKRLELLLMDK